MNRWPDPIGTYTSKEVTDFCVNDRLWQSFRLTLKGLSTSEKLDKLWKRRDGLLLFGDETTQRRYDVQTYNYLNALKRGGQLDDTLKVVK